MKKKILLVEDEQDLSVVFNMVLEDGGYEVDCFTDPLLALKNFESGFYDLVILDIKMPEMDGFELHMKLKKIDNAVKICFLTASEMYYEEFRKEEFSGLDKDLFLRKPIKNEDLIKEINRIMNLN
ncbi:MAG TPA: response regulator [Candidatus Nitrosopolaris rasttigaisensis]|jgi:CheY-like chemotaxis protein|nr:response regulator [Candidatus Nitrosopolaris rasttigaisensis]